MVADPSGKICREFGTYIADEGLSLRATFIIDPDGVLRYSVVSDMNVGRSVKETLRFSSRKKCFIISTNNRKYFARGQ